MKEMLNLNAGEYHGTVLEGAGAERAEPHQEVGQGRLRNRLSGFSGLLHAIIILRQVHL